MTERERQGERQEWLRPKDVARRLAVSTKTVLKWVRDGEVRHFRRGQTVRVAWPIERSGG